MREFVADRGRGEDLPELNEDDDPEGDKSLYLSYAWAPGDKYSAYLMDWDTADAFCDWLSAEEGLTYRLPSEAEWEYAARAGTDTKHWWGEAWKECMVVYRDSGYFGERAPFRNLAVAGTYACNPFGPYEILGNASEWTLDWYDEDTYRNSPRLNPRGPKSGSKKVYRGGWLGSLKEACRSEHRASNPPRIARPKGVPDAGYRAPPCSPPPPSPGDSPADTPLGPPLPSRSAIRACPSRPEDAQPRHLDTEALTAIVSTTPLTR